MKNNITEILAPAGNMESVISAINAGADAIYLGGQDFNARNSNDNFSNEEIKEIVSLCALYDIRVNLTVNTLIKDSEYSNLVKFLDEMYQIGIYAFIIQDISLIKLIKERYKNVKVHASTQMSAHSMLDVLHLKELGFDRVVLSRECSFDEIKVIKESVDIEIEVFVHGALCVSYSGECLMSSLIGGRSGNRGRCAQPCRKTLSLIDTTINESVMDGYLLSPKDVSQLPNIDKLLKIGIDTIKIEGRMKSAQYVYQTTKTYRDKINSIINGDEFDEKEATKGLLTAFNRGGEHTTGYMSAHSSIDIMSIKTPKATGTFVGIVTDYNKVSGKCVIKLQDDVFCGDGIEIWTKNKNHVGTNISKDGKYGQNYLVNIKGEIRVNDKVYKSFNKTIHDEIKGKYSKLTRKKEVLGSFQCIVGKPFSFSLKFGDIVVTKQSVIVEETSEKPISKDVIIEKLSKTGNTPFSIKFGDFEISENAFIMLKNINELKREVITELEEKVKNSVSREGINDFLYSNVNKDKILDKKDFSVYVEDLDKIEEIISLDFQRLYIPFDNGLKTKVSRILDLCEKNQKDLYIKLPTITGTDTEILIDNDIEILKEQGVRGFLVSNYGQILMCQDVDIILDYNFNVLNSNSVQYLQSMKDIEKVTLSMEATLEEIQKMENNNTEVIIHGRQVVMETRACPVGIYISGKNEQKFCQRRNQADNYVLRDKMNMDFPIKPNCNTCICQIYNSSILFMMDKYKDLQKLRSSLRINITTEENPKEIISGYINGINNNHTEAFDIKDRYNKNITKGHFYRGVQ